MEFDLIVRNGIIVSPNNHVAITFLGSDHVQVNASDCVVGQDIGIRDGVIVCIGSNLQSTHSDETQVLDCEGAFVTPGGIDTHVHLEQWNTPTGDTWETGTRSAICGGTTTVVAFASQKREDETVLPIVEEYGALAAGRAYCDYAYHLILTNPTKKIVEEELPLLVKETGITSVKLYMTYDPMKLPDRAILNIMVAARKLGITTMIHAENHDMIALYVLLSLKYYRS